MPAPNIVKIWQGRTIIRCPICGLEAIIDDDQFHGRVSIECPECTYHETHDLSSTAPRELEL